MGSGWLINYLTNRTRRSALQKELRQKRIALEKIRKICLDEIEKILKSRNNRAIKVAARQPDIADTLTTAEYTATTVEDTATTATTVKETLAAAGVELTGEYIATTVEDTATTATTVEETLAAAGFELTGDNVDKVLAKEKNNEYQEAEPEPYSIGDDSYSDDDGSADEVLTFLVAILCYASYNGIIPNDYISSSIEICSSNSIKCLQGIANDKDVSVEDIIPCLPGTITSALSSVGVDITGDNVDNVRIGERVSKRQPISSLKKQLKLATYNLENIRNYCKKILIESVPKERNSRQIAALIILVSTIACMAANHTISSSEAKTCAESVIGCLEYYDYTDMVVCLSDLI